MPNHNRYFEYLYDENIFELLYGRELPLIKMKILTQAQHKEVKMSPMLWCSLIVNEVNNVSNKKIGYRARIRVLSELELYNPVVKPVITLVAKDMTVVYLPFTDNLLISKHVGHDASSFARSSRMLKVFPRVDRNLYIENIKNNIDSAICEGSYYNRRDFNYSMRASFSSLDINVTKKARSIIEKERAYKL